MAETAIETDVREFLREKTIVLTGANGYVGTAVLSVLQGVSCRVFALARTTPPPQNLGYQHVTWWQCDFMDDAAWREPLLRAEPDIVIHLAAHEHRHGSQHAPRADLALNAGSVLHLLETCVELQCNPRIVFASSANLVGLTDRVPVDETFADRPLTLFGIHKLTGERYLQHYARQHGIQSVPLRFTNIYGQMGSQEIETVNRVLLNRIMHLAMTSGVVTLFANRRCKRDFVHLSDVVGAICVAAVHPSLVDGTPYIVGSEEESSLEGVFHIIKETLHSLFDLDMEIRLDDQVPLASVEWREFVADCGRMRRATGWTPEVKLEEGVRRTLSWLGRETGRSPAL
jgi:UDP-glucose 4-epimerase